LFGENVFPFFGNKLFFLVKKHGTCVREGEIMCNEKMVCDEISTTEFFFAIGPFTRFSLRGENVQNNGKITNARNQVIIPKEQDPSYWIQRSLIT
jgi:hypothetical protein